MNVQLSGNSVGYEERSQAEIGEILGCTAKAVETRIYRARQQLRVSLGKLLDTL